MKELVRKFIEKYQVPEDYKCVKEHYSKKYDDKNIVEDFLNEGLLLEIDDISKNNIEKIEKFNDYIDFTDWITDIYNEDLIKNIELFWEFIETFWDKDNFYENLMNWQNKAYQEFLEDIKNNFVEFIKEQLD